MATGSMTFEVTPRWIGSPWRNLPTEPPWRSEIPRTYVPWKLTAGGSDGILGSDPWFRHGIPKFGFGSAMAIPARSQCSESPEKPHKLVLGRFWIPVRFRAMKITLVRIPHAYKAMGHSRVDAFAVTIWWTGPNSMACSKDSERRHGYFQKSISFLGAWPGLGTGYTQTVEKPHKMSFMYLLNSCTRRSRGNYYGQKGIERRRAWVAMALVFGVKVGGFWCGWIGRGKFPPCRILDF